MIENIRALLSQSSPQERRQIFDELRATIDLHPFEKTMNAKAEVILEALARASDLTLRGIRGIIGEATFVLEVAPTLQGWSNVMPSGDHAFDALMEDAISRVRVQCKMQRRKAGSAWLRNGRAVVEVQRTRTGKRNGEATRPYRFGEFDLLAVCMEPSHGAWNSFLYIPERWLNSRSVNSLLIEVLQPVSLVPDNLWTNSFDLAVQRLRSGKPRPT